ncbi:hypothetical protein EYC55_12370 [Xanthomonas oryzae]|nr:hypothetical protein EYC55_12370 [Xanthomonas oryzae]
MICSSEKRFFTSNLLGIGNWTPNRCATQTRGDVAASGTRSLPNINWKPCNAGFQWWMLLLEATQPART